jgi:hypothetical protein
MLYRYVEREGAESTRVTIFLGGGEGIRRGLKPGLLRVCNDQGSRFIQHLGATWHVSPEFPSPTKQ